MFSPIPRILRSSQSSKRVGETQAKIGVISEFVWSIQENTARAHGFAHTRDGITGYTYMRRRTSMRSTCRRTREQPSETPCKRHTMHGIAGGMHGFRTSSPAIASSPKATAEAPPIVWTPLFPRQIPHKYTLCTLQGKVCYLHAPPCR